MDSPIRRYAIWGGAIGAAIALVRLFTGAAELDGAAMGLGYIVGGGAVGAAFGAFIALAVSAARRN